ncbi:hypothetical protein HY382_00955 [Candidatus Curtissbacteria bacterium]|nr:hypothetical protein [Candidatus Curtissbacteria bacterium]
MPAKKVRSKTLNVRNSSTFLMLALLLVAALFLLIAFGPFSADKLGLLGKRQENQQSEAALLPPEGGSSNLKPPCRFRVGRDATWYSYGDIDRDGFVTSVDALLIQKTIAGTYAQKNSQQPYLYEVEDVGKTNPGVSGIKDVNSSDSLLILRYVSKLTDTFPACSGDTFGLEVTKS